MAKPGRPKREKPLTEEELAQRRLRYDETRRKKRQAESARYREEKRLWKEIGWIVHKMNHEAKISRESIWTLLGGMVSQRQIKDWCEKGKPIR